MGSEAKNWKCCGNKWLTIDKEEDQCPDADMVASCVMDATSSCATSSRNKVCPKGVPGTKSGIEYKDYRCCDKLHTDESSQKWIVNKWAEVPDVKTVCIHEGCPSGTNPNSEGECV